MARPYKLRAITQSEVRAKTKELGSIRLTASYYACSEITVKRKIGDFQYKGITPEHLAEIKKMSKTHTKKAIGDLLGYSVKQIVCAGRKYGIDFSGRKPRSNSKLTHREINNMDLIIKQYPTMQDCANDHDVSLRCIQEHVYKCRKIRGQHELSKQV
jgi:hypothetical protein